LSVFVVDGWHGWRFTERPPRQPERRLVGFVVHEVHPFCGAEAGLGVGGAVAFPSATRLATSAAPS
jgi:hypothetical protein